MDLKTLIFYSTGYWESGINNTSVRGDILDKTSLTIRNPARNDGSIIAGYTAHEGATKYCPRKTQSIFITNRQCTSSSQVLSGRHKPCSSKSLHPLLAVHNHHPSSGRRRNQRLSRRPPRRSRQTERRRHEAVGRGLSTSLPVSSHHMLKSAST